jgi:hypothetical protein
MSSSLAMAEQGVSYKMEALIRFNRSKSLQCNYTEIRDGENLYVRIAIGSLEKRVYVHRSDLFSFVSAYDNSHPYLASQQIAMQFRPLSFAFNLALDLVTPVRIKSASAGSPCSNPPLVQQTRPAANLDQLLEIVNHGIRQYLHFSGPNQELKHLSNLTLISSSGFELELLPISYDDRTPIDSKLFEVSRTFLTTFGYDH